MPPMNDDQFEETLHRRLLADEGFAEDELDLYLDLEEEDAADLALMREALDNYKAETLRFAEQQSAAMPAPRVSRVAALWDGTPRWAVATTAVVALGFSAAFVTHRNTAPATVTLAAAPSAQALADDNRLLLSVDQALSTSVAPSEEELGLSAIPAHTTRHGRTTN